MFNNAPKHALHVLKPKILDNMNGILWKKKKNRTLTKDDFYFLQFEKGSETNQIFLNANASAIIVKNGIGVWWVM